MPRSPIASTARKTLVSMRTTEPERHLIDQLRGSLTVSDYLRSLVNADAKRRNFPGGLTA